MPSSICARSPRGPRAIEREVQIGRSGTHLFDSYLAPPGIHRGSLASRHALRTLGTALRRARRSPSSSPGSPPRPRSWAGTACSCGTTWPGGRRCARSPTRGSPSPPRRRPPSGCCSARWSPRSPAGARRSSPARPRRWTCSAAAGWCSASAWAATGSAASSPPPATRWTTAAAARCSTRRWPSSTPPGRGSRCTTAASTTSWTTSRSCPAPRTRIPVWVAGFPGSARPRRRAATRDGFFPVNLEHPDQLAAAHRRPATCPTSWWPAPRAPTSRRSPPPARPGGSPTSTRRDHRGRGPRRAAGRPGVSGGPHDDTLASLSSLTMSSTRSRASPKSIWLFSR